MVRAGHPLDGQRLRVDRSLGEDRKDGRIAVVLPDGSTTLLALDWTDAARPGRQARRASHVRLNVGGLRRLLRLVEQISASATSKRTP